MIEVLTKAQYNEMLMRDAMEMLEHALDHVAVADSHLRDAKRHIAEAKEKYEQLRLDV